MSCHYHFQRRTALWAMLVSGFIGAASAEEVRQVHGLRIELGELVPDAPAELHLVDIGQSPPPGSSRLVTRKQVEQQLAQAGFASDQLQMPATVRARAEGKTMSASELSDWLAPAIKSALPQGVELVQVRTSTRLTLSPEAKVADIRVPKLPKRVGTVQLGLTAVLSLDGETTHHLPLVVVVSISPQAADYEVRQGATVTLVIQRRTLRITAAATALGGADIGDIAQFRVQSTGRTLKARVVSRDQAVVVESL